MKWVAYGYGKDRYGHMVGIIESYKYKNGGYNDIRPLHRLQKHAKDFFGVECEDVQAFIWVDLWEEEEKIESCKNELKLYCREIYTIYGNLVTTCYGNVW